MKRRLEGGIIVSRLIDADNLDFTFDRRCFSEGDTQYVRGADDAIGVVNNAPTIDAVPVVRCRECKYWLGEHVCDLDCNHETHTGPDDFCSRGQRKEADHEVSEP